jgi:periplasmic divalent cation tolerance protein
MTYVDDDNVAEKLAETLLTEKLAACVGILPGKSRYWWQGEIVKNDNELHIIIKTKESLIDEAMERIKQLHTYDLPAIDVIDVEKVNDGIEAWLNEVTR